MEALDDLGLDALQQPAIVEDLRRAGGHYRATEFPGISRFALRRRTERYGIL